MRVTDPSGLHQLRPVSVSDGRVLKFPDSSQRRHHVFDGVLGAVVRVPRPRLLVQHSQLLRELLAFLIHEFDVDLAPRRVFPVVEGRVDNDDVIPDVLDHDQLASTRLQLLVLGHDHLEHSCRGHHRSHFRL